jgi:hypothetical protein
MISEEPVIGAIETVEGRYDQYTLEFPGNPIPEALEIPVRSAQGPARQRRALDDGLEHARFDGLQRVERIMLDRELVLVREICVLDEIDHAIGPDRNQLATGADDLDAGFDEIDGDLAARAALMVVEDGVGQGLDSMLAAKWSSS